MAVNDHQKRFLSPSYRPDIDGLRAVAILPVLFFHAFPQYMWGGFTGVDIFFVISGFFISTIVLENLKNESFSFWGFYGRRIRRIFPALILIMVSSLIAGYFVLTAAEYKDLGRGVYAGAGFFANFILWKTEAPDISNPMLHLWSLSIEEQFYIVWPLLLGLAWKLRVNLLVFVLLLTGLSFATNIMSLNDGAYVFSMPHTRVWELLLGGALAYLIHFRKPLLLDNSHLQNGLSFAGALLLLIGFVVIKADTAFPGYRGLLPTIGTFLIILAGQKAWINRIILSHPLIVWVGLISYPLYLWHWQILYFQRILTGSLSSLPLTLFSISLSILLAWATYQFVEKPIRFGPHRKVKSFILVGCMVAFGAAGVLLYMHEGIKGRFKERDSFHDYIAQEKTKKDDVFRSKCGFVIPENGQVQDTLPTDCTSPPAHSKKVIFLWGDSQAQQLYWGLEQASDGKDWGVLQVATDSCIPLLDGDLQSDLCRKSNSFALKAIKSTRPDVVIVAQDSYHDTIKSVAIQSTLTDFGVRQVIFTGPIPHWKSDPNELISSATLWEQGILRTNLGLDQNFIVRNSELVKEAVRMRIDYVDITSRLCRDDGCQVRVAINSFDSYFLDRSHLSRMGSLLVAKELIIPQILKSGDKK